MRGLDRAVIVLDYASKYRLDKLQSNEPTDLSQNMYFQVMYNIKDQRINTQATPPSFLTKVYLLGTPRSFRNHLAPSIL